ncbi:MAG: SLC13 family permease [Pseudomonadota bacterium]
MPATTPLRSHEKSQWPAILRHAGLVVGPLLAGLVLALPPPAGLSPEASRVAAVAVLMAVWWMTEALPLPATALLPLVLFPFLGIAGIETVGRSYADPLIFLFFGGFVVATAIQKWQLNLHIALWTFRLARGHPAGCVAATMAATAFLSMWVSNTATTMAMLPIALSIVAGAKRQAGADADVTAFAAALMLGIAYAASIGGMGTLIGTPPNALFAGFMRDNYGIEVTFLDWMTIGTPAVAILLPIAWLILTRVAFRFSLPRLSVDAQGVGAEPGRQGPLPRGARMTAAVAVLTVLAWIGAPWLRQLLPLPALTDAGIAMAASILLFALPVDLRQGVFLLRWSDLQRLPWGVLIIFGGGLALAEAIGRSGLAAWVGGGIVALGGLPLIGLIFAAAVLVVLLGELASNTAIAAIFLPIAGALALDLGQSPVTLALPIALAASVGFMLPVATPPNAIVYGSEAVTARQMLRAGMLLDLVGAIVVTLLAIALGGGIGGVPAIDPTGVPR